MMLDCRRGLYLILLYCYHGICCGYMLWYVWVSTFSGFGCFGCFGVVEDAAWVVGEGTFCGFLGGVTFCALGLDNPPMPRI